MATKFVRKSKFKPVREKREVFKNIKEEDINYKNIELLSEFVRKQGKIASREITGVSVQEQRKIVTAVKNARELALLPFVKVEVKKIRKKGEDKRNERKKPKSYSKSNN
jgi:small subunit ribosomal protein S18